MRQCENGEKTHIWTVEKNCNLIDSSYPKMINA